MAIAEKLLVKNGFFGSPSEALAYKGGMAKRGARPPGYPLQVRSSALPTLGGLSTAIPCRSSLLVVRSLPSSHITLGESNYYRVYFLYMTTLSCIEISIIFT
jgi:hypothetical protein